MNILVKDADVTTQKQPVINGAQLAPHAFKAS